MEQNDSELQHAYAWWLLPTNFEKWLMDLTKRLQQSWWRDKLLSTPWLKILLTSFDGWTGCLSSLWHALQITRKRILPSLAFLENSLCIPSLCSISDDRTLSLHLMHLLMNQPTTSSCFCVKMWATLCSWFNQVLSLIRLIVKNL